MNVGTIKSRILVKYPLFGSIVANTNFIAESLVVTVGTDGKNIYYNPSFIESITEEEQIFIFTHEICHIAFNHVIKSNGKNKEIWNIAADAVVNAFLKEDGLKIPKDGVNIPEAINFDVEEMYNKLLKENIENQQNNSQGNISQNNDLKNQNDKLKVQLSESHIVEYPTHSMWDTAIEKRHQYEQLEHDLRQFNSQTNNKLSLLDKLRKMFDKRKKQQEKQQQLDERQNNEQEKKKNEAIKKLTELGEKETFKQNIIERKKQLEELRKALVSQSHGYGSNTNSERRNITGIGISEPLIDWKKLLRQDIKYDIDWSYQNAEIENGIVTARLEEIPRTETEIILDTSGSIDETLLRNFLRECKSILQTSKIKVGCFDTKFYGFTEVNNESDINKLPFYGGGGTNFEVAINAFTRSAENKIIFTDGDAKMPITSMDVIWIVYGEVHINPKGGKVIYINNDQLDKLYLYDNNMESKGRTR